MKALLTTTISMLILLASCQKETQPEGRPMFKASITIVSSGDNSIAYKYNSNQWVTITGSDSTVAAFDYFVNDTIKFKASGTQATTTVRLNGHTFGDPVDHCGEINAYLLIQ